MYCSVGITSQLADLAVMAKTTLSFLDLATLALFWKTLSSRGYLIIINVCTLRCSVSENELADALNNYDAAIIIRLKNH